MSGGNICFFDQLELKRGLTFCRMSGLWGPQSALDLYLQEEGITTLLFAGVNADQVSFLLVYRLYK